MKKTLLILSVLLLSVSFLFTSCGKDNDENTIIFDSTRTKIQGGFLTYYGNRNFDLLIYSEGLVFDENSQTFTGEGKRIYAEMWSSSSNDLEDGSYSYYHTNASFSFTKLRIMEEDGTINFYNGTIEVRDSGSKTRITINAKDSAGKALKVVFFNSLRIYPA